MLQHFGDCTNLRMNAAKSECMLIGRHSEEITQIIKQCNLSVTKQITHLGIIFDSKLDSLPENWDAKIQKMNKIKNLILALHPSLCTKILLVKSFLMSQIVYISPVIPINDAQLIKIEEVITSFICPRRKTFSSRRIFYGEK